MIFNSVVQNKLESASCDRIELCLRDTVLVVNFMVIICGNYGVIYHTDGLTSLPTAVTAYRVVRVCVTEAFL